MDSSDERTALPLRQSLPTETSPNSVKHADRSLTMGETFALAKRNEELKRPAASCGECARSWIHSDKKNVRRLLELPETINYREFHNVREIR